MLDPQQWKDAYFVLQKSNLFICPRNDGAAEDIINLKRLQELSLCLSPGPVRVLVPVYRRSDFFFCACVEGVASENDNQEKKDILVLVEKGR